PENLNLGESSRRPLTMFSDHDNPVTAAAAAPADEAQSLAAPENPNQQQAAHETPSQRTEEDPLTPKTPVGAGSDEAHARAEANAAQSASDAEAAAAAEEAAGSEEMSKLLEQYDEQHEAQAQNEIIEVKVIAYTEHGVVVDLGQKTEGLIPAVEF